MKWILEKDVFDEGLDPLKEAIVKRGMEYFEVIYKPFQSGIYPNYDSSFVFYGSIELAKQLREQTKCMVFYTPEIYDCHTYYPYFGSYVLNYDCTFLTLKEFKEQSYNLFEKYGVGKYGGIFIRPDSGDKSFTGMVTYPHMLEKDLEFINRFGTVSDDCKILVSSMRTLTHEVRFVIKDRQVVTGSFYKRGSNIDLRVVDGSAGGLDTKMWQAAELVASISTHQIDRMWTLDLTQTDYDAVLILEIGCFSCAGLYDCDCDAIVAAVEEICK